MYIPHVLQAIHKRDALLRQSEADLLQARSNLKSLNQEIERNMESARGMERRLQSTQRECEQKERENNALRTEIQELKKELQENYKLHQEAGRSSPGEQILAQHLRIKVYRPSTI